jgi:hypothetical protein
VAKDLTVREFSERLESRLAEMSVQDLRAWIGDAANDVPPNKRLDFLKSLLPPAESPSGGSKGATVLAEIAALRRKLDVAMRKEPEWGHDTDEEPNSFADLLPELERLFGRARALFHKAAFEASADAYRALFELSAVNDSYGRTLGLPERFDVAEERARFLRSIANSGGSGRGRKLLAAWGHLTGYEQVGLTDVFEIASAPIADVEPLLEELIAFLEKQGDDACDSWLWQATRIRFGADGLRQLARQSNGRRPHAWVDWVAVIAETSSASRTVEAADEALSNMPPRLSLRARAAELAFQAAVKLNEPERAVAARWDGFFAARSTRSLLNLWDAAGLARSVWMARAAAESLRRVPEARRARDIGPFRNPLAHSEEWPFEADDGVRVFGQSQAVFYWEAGRKLTSLAYLLAGDWGNAWNRAKAEKVLGWSSSESSQALVVPAFFARLAGAPERPLPWAVDQLWKAALSGVDDSPYELDHDPLESDGKLTANVGRALYESMGTWTLDSATAAAVVGVAVQRVDAIVEQKHRGAYERAACLTLAAAEVIDRRGEREESQWLLHSVIDRHRRKHAFTREIKKAQERRAGTD